MDIDLVNTQFTQRQKIEKSMGEIGFSPVGRHFEHPETGQIVEFPPGPLILGNARVEEIIEIEFVTGTLRVISPTDCVKDRLAHYYHWGDRQCLAQAVLVSENHPIYLVEIENWSKNEGKQSQFEEIRDQLEASSHGYRYK